MDARNSIETPRPLRIQLMRIPALSSERATIGKMSLNGVFQCFTLERPADGKNAPDLSAIPEGTYPVVERWSHHFGRNLLGLQNVPGRSDIEIHIGNVPEDIKGCIVVGNTASKDFVGNSATAFAALMSKFTSPATISIETATAEGDGQSG